SLLTIAISSRIAARSRLYRESRIFPVRLCVMTRRSCTRSRGRMIASSVEQTKSATISRLIPQRHPKLSANAAACWASRDRASSPNGSGCAHSENQASGSKAIACATAALSSTITATAALGLPSPGAARVKFSKPPHCSGACVNNLGNAKKFDGVQRKLTKLLATENEPGFDRNDHLERKRTGW